MHDNEDIDQFAGRLTFWNYSICIYYTNVYSRFVLSVVKLFSSTSQYNIHTVGSQQKCNINTINDALCRTV